MRLLERRDGRAAWRHFRQPEVSCRHDIRRRAADSLSTKKSFSSFTAPVEGVNSYSVMGFSQGKFSIGQTSDGEKVVTKDTTKAPVQKVAGLTRGNLQVISLSEFKALVRRYLNQ